MGAAVPLSEFEKRQLESIGHDLAEEDPGFAALLGRDAFVLCLRNRFRRGLLLVAAGVCVLLLGLVVWVPWLGIAGFAIMIGAGYWAVKDFRWSSGTVDREVTQMEGNNE